MEHSKWIAYTLIFIELDCFIFNITPGFIFTPYLIILILDYIDVY
jgi:hypothetical protein